MKINFAQLQADYIQINSKRTRVSDKNVEAKPAVLSVKNIAKNLKIAYFMPLSTATKNERCLEAASKGHLSTVKTLVKAGAQINSREGQWEQGALHQAILSGHAHMVQNLVKLGCDINQQDHLGRTPLFLAVETHQAECVRELLKNNANADLADYRNWSPLHVAAQLGREEITEVLLAHGASPNPRSRTNDTPCDLSIVSGNLNVSRTLIPAGGVVSERTILDHRLHTPLNRGALDLVSEFIANNQYNADIDLSETLPNLMQEPTLLNAIRTRRNHIQTELTNQYTLLNRVLNAPAKDKTKISMNEISDQIPNITQYALNYPSRSLPDLMFPDQPKFERNQLLKEWMDGLLSQPHPRTD